MQYFNEISPESEELLQEIIDLKANKSDRGEYWHNRFDSMAFDDEATYRSLFGELKSVGLISVSWANNIPYILTLTNKGKNYFKHKEIQQRKIEHSRKPMGFITLDNMSVRILQQFINSTYDIAKSDEDYSVLIDLKDKGMLEFELLQTGSGNDIVMNPKLTHKGRTYFEMKEKHEQELELNKPTITNITTGNNSPVNFASNGSTATQTVDYANNEQIKMLSNLADMVKSAEEFTEEERDEILELIDGAKSATQTGKKVLLKTLITSLGTVLINAPAFIVEKWDEIQRIFGG